ALLLYTSGSSGNPKGVLHNHRNVLVETRNYTQDARIVPEDRLSVWHSFSFANSIRNLFGALMNGAAVHPYDLPERGLMPLPEWVRANGITMIHTLATTFRAFADILPAGATFPSVRVLRLGGEAINTEDVARFRRHFPPPCVLMHVMGPTETFSIRRQFIDHEWRGEPGKVPVGYPVADKEVRLLDGDGRRVGPDEPGEIVVRSRYLAVGYWRQPEMTRAAFLPDPEGGDARLYFTGDLGVMRADGCLTHLGRKDFQVKIRGTRIETAEIEVALSQFDSIKASVVHAHPDPHGEPRLVAYIIAAPGHVPTFQEIRRGLGETLPDVMVPSRFVFLEEFPLLPNGKVDRGALPAPSGQRPPASGSHVAPRHLLEAQIADIWRDLLGVPEVGVHDDFFELGGDSLLAVRLIQRLEAEVGHELPLTLAMLFSAPTVAGLTEAMQREDSGE
ncbi:MAG TPA: non-ribosomal peptide synthetase, partial [Candidatus Eisenbacteria bacterium]|nr:non-ribosomal peptide synthetase [Candidatus Eisenbacteria bacterium]